MGILSDQEVNKVLNRDLVIYPFEKDNLASKGYDLRIGYAIALNHEAKNTDMQLTGHIKLLPKSSAFIISKEFIWLSNKLAATLHARGSLAARGLFINSTTIDCNWKGQIIFLVYNSGDQEVELQVGTGILTMVLHRVDIPTKTPSPLSLVKIVEHYGDIYGDQFENGLLAYLSTNVEVQKDKVIFEESVHKAQTPSAAFMLWVSILSMFASIRLFFKSRFSNAVSAIVWVLTLIALSVSLTMQWYWTWLQKLFNFSESYGPTILIGQVAVVIAALSVLRSLIKDK